MASHSNLLQKLNNLLTDGFEAKLTSDGRIFYISHHTQTTSWLPPRENWDPGSGLPYGWELAIDRAHKPYYINHVEKYTTREDPRDDPDYVEPPKPREVELIRDPNKGFGFVAGSEKPVIVRFVTEAMLWNVIFRSEPSYKPPVPGALNVPMKPNHTNRDAIICPLVKTDSYRGPSVDKLLPGDQIIKIHGEDVKRAPREYVIDLVRACKHSMKLTVCQPYVDNSSRKSALLTAAKKARLKSNPSRVRFADSVIVNGASVHGPSVQESYVPLMPNVLKVFLENGQTKSFKYDNKTTVKDVLVSMQEKLNIDRIEHFALVLQNTKSVSHSKFTILQEQETLAEIAARPGAMHFRCLFRVTYVPKDAYDLLREDTIAFEYFYMQCCNDVIQERFASELKYDTALRLAALQIQQHVMSNNTTNKISLKTVERDCGLEKFVPPSLLDSMKGKDIRKIIHQYLKMNQSLTAPGQKQLTALQAKLHYLKIISELKTFGSRIFMVTILDRKSEGMVLVGPKSGVSVITNMKSYATAVLTEFEDIERIDVSKEGESMYRVDISLTDENLHHVCLGLLKEDLNNFLALIEGYHRIYSDGSLLLTMPSKSINLENQTPPYEAQHKVVSSCWSYPDDIVSQVISPANGDLNTDNISEDERIVDLSLPPPPYVDDGKSNQHFVNDEESITSEDDTTSTDEASVKEACISSNGLPPLSKQGSSDESSSSSNLNNFEEGVTSFGRVSSSSEAEIESLVQVHVSSNGVDSSESDTISENSQIIPDEIVLKTFTRYVPSPIASLNKRRKSAKLDLIDSTDPQSPLESDDVLQVRVEENGYCLEDLSGETADSSASDADTDSVFGPETERKPLLSTNETGASKSGEYTNTPLAQSESDTDSWGETPENSPSKKAEANVRPSTASSTGRLHLGDLPASFGLHSPDQLPRSEEDYQLMASSFGLHSPDQIPSEMFNAVYDPRLFCDGGLYLDPDIIDKVAALTADSSFPMQHFAQSDLPSELWILFYMVNCYVSESSSEDLRGSSPSDLTMIPPPKTPDDDLSIDFSTMTNPPPPGFTDHSLKPNPSTSGIKATMATEEIDRQFADLCQLDVADTNCGGHEEETDSGNETISSENIELNNGLGEALAEQTNITQCQQKIYNPISRSVEQNSPDGMVDVTSDIDSFIARLTVPPPPSATSPNDIHPNVKSAAQERRKMLKDSHQVPKTPKLDLSLEEEIAALIIPPPPASPALTDIPIVPPFSMDSRKIKTKHFLHRRANSVDLSLLRAKTDQILTKEVEINGPLENAGEDSEKKDRQRHVSDAGLSAQNDAESPSTVSEKLNMLLKSIPFIQQDIDNVSGNSFSKTWSHRERRSSMDSSLSVNSTTSDGTNSQLSRSSSLRVRRSVSSNISRRTQLKSRSLDRGRSRSVSETTSQQLENDKTDNSSKELIPKSILKSKSVEIPISSEPLKTARELPSRSDTFAALKSKLQEYRDIMLRRKHSNIRNADHKDEKSTPPNKNLNKSSPVRRSNSLSDQSKDHHDAVSKRSFPRKQQSLSLSHCPFEGNQHSESTTPQSNGGSGDHHGNHSNHKEKRVPIKPLFNTLPVNFNKLSLRSFTSSGGRQELEDESSGVEDLPVEQSVQVREVKKRGPLKALRAVFESQGTTEETSADCDRSESKEKTSQNKGQGLSSSDGKEKASEKKGQGLSGSDGKEKASEKKGQGLSGSDSKKTTSQNKGQGLSSSDGKEKTSENKGQGLSSSDGKEKASEKKGQGLSSSDGKEKASEKKGQGLSGSDSKETASKSIFQDSDFTTSSDVEESESSAERDMIKRVDLMMWRPISGTSSTRHSNTSRAHHRSASVGGEMTIHKGITTWSDPDDDVTKIVPGPKIRSTNGTSRSQNDSGSHMTSQYSFVTSKCTNFIKFALSKEYDSEKGLFQAWNDVECLVAELEKTMSSLENSRIDKISSQLRMCKNELNSVTRQFVSDVKLVVTSSTQSSAKLFTSVNNGMHTLAKMFLHCHATILMMEDVVLARKLALELTRLASAFGKLIRTSEEVMNSPRSENKIKTLMKNATWLATLLSDFFKLIVTVQTDE